MKRTLFYAIMLLIPLVCAEFFAYQLTRSFGSLFGPNDQVLDAALDEETYQKFLTESYHPELGWQNPTDRTVTEANCIGEEKTYNWDEHGARHTSPLEGDVQIIAVGDSYTHGHEVSDNESYPNRLEELLGVKVANYGVNGFGTLQAALQFEHVQEHHPAAKIAVLGVMSENIRRVPNSYRGIFSPGRNTYLFKPYVEQRHNEPSVQANPNAPPAKSVKDLRPKIDSALETDYWSLPQPSFPYLWSVVRALKTNVFSFLVQRKLAGNAAKVDYDNSELSDNLRHVVDRFIESSTKRGVLPIVAFIPENGKHVDAPTEFIAALRTDRPDTLIIDIGRAEIDWGRYNLNGTVCHPSPYGYEQIARYVASAIEPLLSEGDLLQLPGQNGPKSSE
ncbi:MAG: hypothetical protein ABJN26_08145 [Stappiaceae bacterium]